MTHAYGGIWFPGGGPTLFAYSLCGKDFRPEVRPWAEAPTCPECAARVPEKETKR